MLKPYRFFLGSPVDSGEMIVFEHNARRARVLGFKEWPGYEKEWTEARVRRAPDSFNVLSEQDGPHSVDWYPGDYETWFDYVDSLTPASPSP